MFLVYLVIGALQMFFDDDDDDDDSNTTDDEWATETSTCWLWATAV